MIRIPFTNFQFHNKFSSIFAPFSFSLNSFFSSGKELAAAFEQLPSRRELPDYYEIIEKPMDLNKVKRKIKDGKYHSVQDMGNDIRLLCNNARVSFVH